jgi:hypothetical protein
VLIDLVAKGVIMSKRALAVALMLALTVLAVGVASAQVPYIAVYFNSGFSQEAKDCPGVGVFDTWYVAAVNFNMFLAGADFKIEYPPAVNWIADLQVWTIFQGTTPTGYSVGFPFPQNGFVPVPLVKPYVMWNCEECMPPWQNNQVKVVPNPATGFLGAVGYPGFGLVPSLGLTALICPLPIATEQTTWGQVKAVYGE